MKKSSLWKTAVVTTSVLSLALCLGSCKQATDDSGSSNSSNNAKVEEKQKELDKLNTRYVKPLQFDVKNISGIAITKKSSTSGRFATTTSNPTDVVVIKDDGTTEAAIALGTQENTGITEATEKKEEGAIYKYVTPENNVIATVLETKQCAYELNDKEAGGYYIVFDGKSTFTYDDGSTKYTGSLIYVTPDGTERDIFGDANLFDNTVNFYQTAEWGNPYMQFDENGNAFFMSGNKFYRYQPVANKLDDLTPTDLSNLYISSFAVSLDGKYIVATCYVGNTKYCVKAIKVADKTSKDIYTSVIPKDNFSSSNIIYFDKNHSFYFTTNSWATDGDDRTASYNGAENYVNRWCYEWYGTDKIEKTSYKENDKYTNSEIGEPSNGNGPLILTDEGIFVMKPEGWVWTTTTQPREGNYTYSRLVKITDGNGNYIKCTVPSSLSGFKFAQPRYNQKVTVDYKDTTTWYKPSFFSNGQGIAVIGRIDDSDTIVYYSNGQLKNLLAFDTDDQKINSMTLSDKSIIFNSTVNNAEYTKSINLEDGSITKVSINGNVLNLLAVKGKSISPSNSSEAKLKWTVTIDPQSDVKVTAKIENNKLTIEAPAGYEYYRWSCNGYTLLDGNGATKYEADITNWTKGYYPIYFVAKKGNLAYSTLVEVENK